jgi:hypothetical protein
MLRITSVWIQDAIDANKLPERVVHQRIKVTPRTRPSSNEQLEPLECALFIAFEDFHNDLLAGVAHPSRSMQRDGYSSKSKGKGSGTSVKCFEQVNVLHLCALGVGLDNSALLFVKYAERHTRTINILQATRQSYDTHS